jgi:hypothetical protein
MRTPRSSRACRPVSACWCHDFAVANSSDYSSVDEGGQSRTLEMAAAALDDDGGPPLRSSRDGNTASRSQRLAAVAVLADHLCPVSLTRDFRYLRLAQRQLHSAW